MLHKHLKPQPQVANPFLERRRDVLTRAVVKGLEQLNAHIEQLRNGPDRAAAQAAVACFAMRIKDALNAVNDEARENA